VLPRHRRCRGSPASSWPRCSRRFECGPPSSS
jgi:hypothetical protein